MCNTLSIFLITIFDFFACESLKILNDLDFYGSLRIAVIGSGDDVSTGTRASRVGGSLYKQMGTCWEVGLQLEYAINLFSNIRKVTV